MVSGARGEYVVEKRSAGTWSKDSCHRIRRDAEAAMRVKEQAESDASSR